MDWVQFGTFLIVNFAFTLTLWLWNRSESNSDRREMMTLLKAISDEMKDFHGRLCAIEERRIKILEK
jgi:hypothetical protein